MYVLFLTEMWERFSFYGMRVLLIFYLMEHFLFDDSEGILIVGSYNALVNASPLLGGFIADKYFGFKKAVIVGALLMLAGHIGLAYEGTGAQLVTDEFGVQVVRRDPLEVSVMHLALALLIVGVGFLKPSISSLVGRLYAKGDARRDAGFTIFTMGINLGATIAAVVCGYLGQSLGWTYGFGAAALAMLCGLAIFLVGQRSIECIDDPADREQQEGSKRPAMRSELGTYAGTAVIVLTIAYVLHTPGLIGLVLIALSIGCLAYLFWYICWRCEPAQRSRTGALLVVLVFVVGYVVLIEQVSTSLNLFVDRNVDRTFSGVTFQASQVYAVLPAMVIVFAPVVAWLWVALQRKNRNPSVPVKLSIGFVLIGLAYLLLGCCLSFAADEGRVSLIWVVVFFAIMALSDLFVVPIALSSVSSWAEKDVLGIMMGMYFFAISAANYIAALVASAASVPNSNSGGLEAAASTDAYMQLFIGLAVAAAVMAIVMLSLKGVIKRLEAAPKS